MQKLKKNCCVEMVRPLILLYNSTEVVKTFGNLLLSEYQPKQLTMHVINLLSSRKLLNQDSCPTDFKLKHKY
jgi:hypothetical protein